MLMSKATWDSGEKIKKNILELLKKRTEGLTIQDISAELKLHRQTVTKYLFELKGADLIIQRRIGPALLHYLAKRGKSE